MVQLEVGTQIDNGWWVPHGVYGKPFFQKFTKSGLPAHCDAPVRECLKALGSDRRNVAVDGGAYVGVWSSHLLQHFKRVVAFEPIVDNICCYKQNMHMLEKKGMVPKDHHWQLEPCALSFDDRVDWMHDIGKAYGARFTLPEDAPTQESLIQVPTTTLDLYDWEALDLLKLDVEGHEAEALEGSRNVIQEFRPVVIIEEKLDPKKRATRLLRALGMRCVWRQKHDYLFTW